MSGNTKSKSFRRIFFSLTAVLLLCLGFMAADRVSAAEMITFTLDANGGNFTRWDQDLMEYVPTAEQEITLTLEEGNSGYLSDDESQGYFAPVRDGKVLMGWMAEKKESGALLGDYSLSFFGDHHLSLPAIDRSLPGRLYAAWTDEIHLHLDANGGTFQKTGTGISDVRYARWEEKSGYYYSYLEGDPTPRRNGYLLMGWSRDKNASVPEYSYYEDAPSSTLYAVWSKIYHFTLFGNKEGYFGTETIGGVSRYLESREVRFHFCLQKGKMTLTDEEKIPMPVRKDKTKVLVAWNRGIEGFHIYRPDLSDLDLEDLSTDTDNPDEFFAVWADEEQRNISGIAIPEITVPYTGRAQKPSPLVKLPMWGGITLREGTDYLVSYSNNIEPGTASMEITGTGIYTGTIYAGFTITPKETEAPSTEETPKENESSKAEETSAPGKNKKTDDQTGKLPGKGTKLTHSKSGAVYIVSGKEKEVSYKKAPAGKKKITVPKTVTLRNVRYTVTAISSNAFKGNTTVQEVTIENKVTKIGEKAFSGCTGLKKVKGGSGVKSIGAGAFNGCRKLSAVSIGSKVTSIGDKAFAGCSVLNKIILPAGIKSIGKEAFLNCRKLSAITIKTTKLTGKNVGKNAFKGTAGKATVKVPKKVKKEYKTLLPKKGVSTKAKITQYN